IPSAADGGHLGANPLCDLNRKCPNTTSRAVDQYFLSALKPGFIPQPLQGGYSRDRHRSCLFKTRRPCLQNNLSGGCAHKLGERSSRNTKNFIVRPERFDVPAYGFHNAGDISANSWLFLASEPEERPEDHDVSGKQVIVQRIQTSSANSDQNFIVARYRCVYFFKSETIRCAVFTRTDGFHKPTLRTRGESV